MSFAFLRKSDDPRFFIIMLFLANSILPIRFMALGYSSFSTCFEVLYVSSKDVLLHYMRFVYGVGVVIPLILNVIVLYVFKLDIVYWAFLLDIEGFVFMLEMTSFWHNSNRNVWSMKEAGTLSSLGLLIAFLIFLSLFITALCFYSKIVSILLISLNMIILLSCKIWLQFIYAKYRSNRYKLMQSFRGQ